MAKRSRNIKKVKSGIKKIRSGAEKYNPLNTPLNMNDTTDTGAEATKLGYKTVKKTKDTVKKTVNTAKDIYKAPVRIIKIARISSTIIVHLLAFLLNPVFWIIIFVLFFVFFFAVPIIVILSGGAVAGTTNNKAYVRTAGSNQEISSVFPEAEHFYDLAADDQQDEFDSFIDSLYYSVDDLPNSDLVYMVCSNGTTFEKTLVTDNKKQQIKEQFSKTLSKAEAIALVYTYLQREKNLEKGTVGEIYEVEFTKEAFDDLLNMMVSWTDNIYDGQECPSANCSAHQEEIHNPRYDELSDKVDTLADAYNDWYAILPYFETYESIEDGRGQRQYWDNSVQWRIDNWKLVYGDAVPIAPYYTYSGGSFLEDIGDLYERYLYEFNNTPESTIEIVVECEHLHELHSIGLNVLSKDDVMDAWNFSEIDKQWYEVTYMGFVYDPDIEVDS